MTSTTPTEVTLDYSPVGRNGSAVITAKLGDDILAHEKIDLGKPEKREAFAESVCKGRPGIDADDVRRQLLSMGAELADQQSKREKKEPEPDANERLQRMPEHVKAQARVTLESPDLLKSIIADVGALGVAGEKELVATIYLVGVSRLLPRPLAAIVQAPSSTGKSYVLDKVASLFPPRGCYSRHGVDSASSFLHGAGRAETPLDRIWRAKPSRE